MALLNVNMWKATASQRLSHGSPMAAEARAALRGPWCQFERALFVKLAWLKVRFFISLTT